MNTPQLKITHFLLFFLIMVLPSSLTATSTSLQSQSFSRSQLLFGDIIVTLTVTGNLNKDEAYTAMAQGFAIARHMDGVFSTYKENSELSQLNSLAQPVKNKIISADLYKVLEHAQSFYHKTDGFFDITYKNSNVGINDFILHPPSSLSLAQKHMQLDPTGLVKGYIIENIARTLFNNSQIFSVFVAAGGDMIFLTRVTEKHPVQIHQPFTESSQPMPKILLHNTAISTAGLYERGRHIKNTGNSAVEHKQVSVIGKSAVTTDALSTAFLFMPLQKMNQIALQENVRVFVVKSSGESLWLGVE